MRKLEYFIFLFLVITFSSSVYAADKVVVVPLFDSATEQTDTNGYGMKFNLISAGTFTMGSPVSEPGRESNEIQHEVTLSRSFYLQVAEVTQQQWREVVLAAEAAGHLTVDELDENPSGFSACGDQCPVERVSWTDVQDWIAALNQLEDRTGCNASPNSCYRLPTEAEWEYAARAGSTKAFANGAITETGSNFDPNLDAMGWYGYNNVVYNAIGDAIGYPYGPKPVTRQQANAWGLYDMHGNVYEWCQDWYGPYESGPVTDPQGPENGTLRVIRGGSWCDFARHCRSAIRFGYSPDHRGVGFRLAGFVALGS